MLACVLLLLSVIVCYIYFRIKRRSLYELSVPEFGSLPVIGHTHWFLGKSEQILKNILNIAHVIDVNGGLGKVWIGPKLYIVILNPEDVQIILENCLEKDSTYRFLQTWLGNGLFVAPVDLWRVHRRVLRPIFYNKVVEKYIELFGEQSSVLVRRLKEKVGSPEFDIFTYITSCTLDIVFESAMGERMDVQHYPETQYLRARETIMSIINRRMFKVWLQPNCIFKLTNFAKQQNESIEITHKFADEVIKKRRSDFRVQPIKDGIQDLLTLLFQNDVQFTDEELREHIDSITIAGNDTTALVIAYTLMLLGIHQEEQQIVYEEIKNIFGDSKRDPTKEDLNKMDCLERTIKESMRLYTVVPIIARTVQKDVKLASCTLPAGVSCAIIPIAMHRSERIWGTDVDVFNPDRFLPDRSSTRHPAAFIPFSYGARNCIGRNFGMLAMKSILANILRTYKITAKECGKLKIEILLLPVNKHLISIELR